MADFKMCLDKFSTTPKSKRESNRNLCDDDKKFGGTLWQFQFVSAKLGKASQLQKQTVKLRIQDFG